MTTDTTNGATGGRVSQDTHPLFELRRLKRRVQIGVYGGILLSEPFYYFVVHMTLQEMIPGLIIGLIIAFTAIEGAFHQMFKLRKRSAYPGLLLREMGGHTAVQPAAGHALVVLNSLLELSSSAIVTFNANNGHTITTTAGISPESAEALLQACSDEVFAVTGTLLPQRVSRELPEESGLASAAMTVFVPIICFGQCTGILALASDTPKPDLKDAPLLLDIGAALGLALQNLRQTEDLRIGEYRMRSTITGAPLVLYSTDANGVFTFVEGKALESMGMRSEEIIGHHFSEAYTINDESLAAFHSALNGEEVALSAPLRGVMFETRLTPVRDDDGVVTGVIGVSWDVSEKRQAELALLQSERMLRTVVANAPVILFALDANGVFTLSEGRGLEALGLQPGQLVGVSAFDVYREHHWIKENIRRALGGEAFTTVVRYNDIFWETGFSPITDGSGAVTGVIGVAADVTGRERSEEILRASEARFRMMIENSSDGIALVGPDSLIGYAGPSTQRILGYTPEELLGKYVFDLVHPEDFQANADTRETMLNTPGMSTSREARLLRKDGAWIWAEVVATNLLDQVNVQAVVINYRDVTARRTAEDALRDSESRFRSLIENSSDGIMLVQHDGEIIYGGPSTNRILGYEAEELVGRNGFDLVHPEDFRHQAASMAEMLAVPGHTSVAEGRVKHKNGDWIWIELVSTNLLHVPNVQAIVVNYRDITERRAAEHALRVSESRFRSLIENSGDGIALVTFDGTITYGGPSTARILGFEVDELVGKNAFDIIHPDDLEAQAVRLSELLQQPGASNTSLSRIKRKDGSWVWLEMTNTNLLHIPDIGAIVVNYRDVTERRRVEEAIQLSEVRNRALVDAVPDVMFRIGRDGVILDYKAEGSYAALGPPENFIGKHVNDVFGPVVGKATMKGLRAALRTGKVQTVEHQSAGPGGGLSDWEGRFVSSGENEVFVIAREITERKQGERALRESEELYRTLIETSPDAVLFVDLSGHIVKTNKPAVKLLGFRTTRQVEGKSALDFVLEADRDRVREFVATDLDDPSAVGDIEYTLIRKNGTEVPVELRISRVPDAEGNPRGFIAVVRDVSERRRAEQAIRESEAKYRTLVENTNEIIFQLDASGVITYISPVVEQIGGYKPEDVVGRHSAEFIHADDLTEVALSLQRGLAGTPDPSEYRLIDKDGAVHWVRSSSTPVYEDGVIVGLRGVIVEITERKRAEDALIESEERYRTVTELISDYAYGFRVISPTEVQLEWITEAFTRITGYSPAELESRGWITLIHPDDFQSARERMENWANGRSDERETRLVTRSGEVRWIRDQSHTSIAGDGTIRVVGAATDITEQKRAQAALRSSEERYRQFVETAQDVIYTMSSDGTITSLNPAFETISGWPCDEWVGKSFVPLVHPDDLPRATDMVARVLAGENMSFELGIQAKSGDYLVAEFHVTPLVKDGAIQGLLGVARDITERKRAESTIRQLAYHDALTSLPNRTLFEDRLRVALAQAHRSGDMLAVMFLDLDHFKIVNDTLGHGDGDKLLRSVAEDLSRLVREGDTVARVGGDEFTLLLPGIGSTRDAMEVAERILECLKLPRMLGGHEFQVTTSIGITVYPADGSDVETLLRNADTAMYRAKESGRDTCQLYSPGMNATILERLALENDLRHALERNELEVYYQPIVNVQSGEITGAEALVRWHHPTRGLVSPDDFIPVAEESGAIVPIGQWIFAEACRRAQEWRSSGLGMLRVSVNLSARQLQQEDLVTQLAAILAETGLPLDLLQIEITEGAVMKNVDFIIETLTELRKMGIRLAVDDFGTGYSSLSYLKRFPIDSVKIDRSFVRDLATDPNDAAIVTTIIAMARSLNLKVIAEGVETVDQLDFLRRRGCDDFQGYLVSPPIPAKAFQRLLMRSRRTKPAPVNFG